METKVSDLFAELDRGPAVEEAVVSSSSLAEAPVPPGVALPLAQVVPRNTSVEEKRYKALKTIEEELFESSMIIMRDSNRFVEIDAGQTEPPQQWVNELEGDFPGRGLEMAMRRLRAANAGWMTKKDAPVAVQVAAALVVGIGRSRSAEKAGPRTLNVQLVQVSAPLPSFPSLRLQAGEK